jgi:hypothetical protein
MKLYEITLGSRAHAQLIANARASHIPTPRLIMQKVKHSTIPQQSVDAIFDALQHIEPTKKLSRHDMEQLSILADVDIEDLMSLDNWVL